MVFAVKVCVINDIGLFAARNTSSSPTQCPLPHNAASLSQPPPPFLINGGVFLHKEGEKLVAQSYVYSSTSFCELNNKTKLPVKDQNILFIVLSVFVVAPSIWSTDSFVFSTK